MPMPRILAISPPVPFQAARRRVDADALPSVDRLLYIRFRREPGRPLPWVSMIRCERAATRLPGQSWRSIHCRNPR